MIPNTVRGPLMVPGRYTVRLTAGGQMQSAPLIVYPDPHSLGTPETMAAGAQFEQQLIGEIDSVSAMIEQLELARQRAATITERVGNNRSQRAVLQAAQRLADSAMAIEGKLIDIYLTDGNEDLNRHPSQLYQKLTALYDKAKADLGPTASEVEVNDYYQQWMAQSQAALAKFLAKDVPAFDAVLRSHHMSLTP